jgi:peptidoglycan LD-endopeptidase LytH
MREVFRFWLGRMPPAVARQAAMEPEFNAEAPKKLLFIQQWRLRVPLICALGALLIWNGFQHRQDPGTPEIPDGIPQLIDAAPLPEIQITLPPPLPPWPAFSHPSPQRKWNEVDNPKVYMPTGSGRVESAGYGSVRTNSSGRASFHEGVDIAPVEWSRGKAVDKVFAASKGKIAYINRVAGNSSYGIYIVIAHGDDVGEVYTLYAHLASVVSGLKAGQSVNLGQEIAIMGHTSTLGIPVQRSHLHFEMGLMLNPAFDRWYKKQKMTPDHGKYHGFNFAGFDPRMMLIPLSGKEQVPFSYLQTLKHKESAWQILLRTRHAPRYFESYPKLWQGAPYNGGVLLLEISESGIPLRGRNADDAEVAMLGKAASLVSFVNEDALGRNGLRHIIKSGGKWRLGSNGERWLEILMYDAR